MDKKEFTYKTYVRPTIEVVKVGVKTQILAGSPGVQPGGGGGGGIIVIPPTEDGGEELSGAKKLNMCSEWED